MKLVELQANEFDTLSNTEPGSTFFQTSSWAKFYSHLDYEPLYIGYLDDNNIYTGFALLLVKKKKGIFAKSEAICPLGFLINYYDTGLLKSFAYDLNKYLSKKGINKLTISPNVAFDTPRGNNEKLINDLKSIDFNFVKNNIIYTTNVSKIDKYKQKNNISFNAYVASKDELSDVFKLNPNYKYLYEAMPNATRFIICKLDDRKSTDNINATIDKESPYINKHEDNANKAEEVAAKKAIINENYNLLHLVEKCVKENGNNPIISVACLVEYANKINQLFLDERNGYEIFNSLDCLNDKMAQTISELGYTSFDSFKEYPNSTKTKLIGEFTISK